MAPDIDLRSRSPVVETASGRVVGLTASGVLGLYPAAQVNDDDIEIYSDESRSEVLMTWRGLRMQSERPVVDGVRRPGRTAERPRGEVGLSPRRAGWCAAG